MPFLEVYQSSAEIRPVHPKAAPVGWYACAHGKRMRTLVASCAWNSSSRPVVIAFSSLRSRPYLNLFPDHSLRCDVASGMVRQQSTTEEPLTPPQTWRLSICCNTCFLPVKIFCCHDAELLRLVQHQHHPILLLSISKACINGDVIANRQTGETIWKNTAVAGN